MKRSFHLKRVVTHSLRNPSISQDHLTGNTVTFLYVSTVSQITREGIPFSINSNNSPTDQCPWTVARLFQLTQPPLFLFITHYIFHLSFFSFLFPWVLVLAVWNKLSCIPPTDWQCWQVFLFGWLFL